MINNKFTERNILKLLKEKEEYTDLYIHSGKMVKPCINASIKIIEEKLKHLEYPKTIVSRAKLISVELLDNMLKHQLDTSELSSYFEVATNKKELKISASNCISKPAAVYLDKVLSNYKNLSEEEIKQKYIDILTHGELDEKGNAGVGILSVAKRAKKQYEFLINKVEDDKYYFNFTVKLKNENNG